MKHELTLAFVGAGGDGAVAAGDILASACAAEGLNVIKTEAYGPQIRGGESSSVVRLSTTPLFASSDAIDALVIFSWADYARFQSEVTPAPNALLIHEPADAPPVELTDGNRRFLPLPLAKLAADAGAKSGKNIVAVGVLATLFELPSESIRHAIRKRFGKKAAAVIDANMKAFDAGVTAATELFEKGMIAADRLAHRKGEAKLLLSGNEATALAAVDAGCRFFAGYPITPSTEILQFLAAWLPKIGGSTLQTEDELAAIGAVVGGSFAGVKSMTATSGPGLSLMSEMLGLASIAEVPAVVINVQRGGPSTGIPTKSEQSDLYHAVYGGHGDMPRVVIAPSDVEESYHATVDAFNIAEEYQVPVIVLTDQSIAQRRDTVRRDSLVHDIVERRLPAPAELSEYLRYRESDDGVSPMAVPGQPGGMYQTNGLEHDERGRPNASYVVHERMNEKRYRKIDAIRRKYPLYKRIGAAQPDLGILCWGSSAGPVREALARIEGRVGAFIPQLISPLPVEALQKFIDDCTMLLIVELSYAQQFYRYLRSEVDLPPERTHVFSRSGGKVLTAAELEHVAKRWLLGVGHATGHTKESSEVLV
jgi:2-oxoglutarate ferredoxin oxidoreductase subunit alpha